MLYRKKTLSQAHFTTPQPTMNKYISTNHQDIKQLLKEKIRTYSNFRIQKQSNQFSNTKKQKKREKGNQGNQQYPRFQKITDIVNLQDTIYHIFRQRLETNNEEFFYIIMKFIKIAIQYQCQVCKDKIDKTVSIVGATFMFATETLYDLGYIKMAFYFSAISISLGHIYRDCFMIGKALLIMGKTSRLNGKFKQAIILLKKSLEYFWKIKSRQSNDYEIDVYNEFSYNFIQSNMKEQSKIFAQKYEIGYLQPQDSRILNLSKQLVTSVQQRIPTWRGVEQKYFQLQFKVNFIDIVNNYQQILKSNFDQNKIFKLFGVKYDLFRDNFLRHQMFFYEIPLPLQLKKQQLKIPVRKGSFVAVNIIRNRSRSTPQLKVLTKQNSPIEQKIIFNYRGIGISKKKIANNLKKLIHRYSSSLVGKKGTEKTEIEQYKN